MGRWLRGAGVVLVLVTAVAARAQAVEKKLTDGEKQRARALYDEGVRHYNVANYDAAVEAWKGAYMISGDPHLLFDVAQSYRLAGNCESAVRFYRNFLRESPQAKETAQVEAAIAKCEKALAEAPPPAPPPVAQTEPIPAPPPPPVIAPASATAEPAAVSRSAEPLPDAGRRKRVGGVVVAGIGAAVTVTGVVLGLQGRSRQQALDRHQGEWSNTEKHQEESAQRLGTAGQILTGVGATAVVAGAVLYLVGASERRPSGVSVSVGPHGGGMAWTGTF
jgi:tetratricopeptide (TPR) repeat protein